MNAFQEQFVTEARELVGQALDDLIALEREGTSPERIDRVFRAFHTLKGSAGVVELPILTMTLHAAEDLLASVRQGDLEASAEIVDASLACLDQVARWVDDFERAGALPPQAAADGRTIADRLKSFLPSYEPSTHLRQASDATAPNSCTVPDWALQLIERNRDQITAARSGLSSSLTAISYEPLAACFYNGDDPLQLMRAIPELLAFHVEPREAWPPLTELDPYACNVRLQAISAASGGTLAKIFQLVPDQIKVFSLPAAIIGRAEIAQVANNANMELVVAIIAAQCELLRGPDRSTDLIGCVGSVRRTAANALRYGGQSSAADEVERSAAETLSTHNMVPLLTTLERVLISYPTEPLPDAVDGASPAAVRVGSERPAERLLRVSEVKIEALVNLAGELIIAKNALAHSSRLADQSLSSGEAAEAIRRDYEAIDRLTSELHSTILQLRMVPLAQAFRTFPRLVRDVSRQLDKNVALETHGENTEADKTIVDRLFEPLVHLARNAVDHGIESPENRRNSGKPETATISLKASRAANRFLVEVSDDGRGINADVVRRKASDKNLLPDSDLAALSDEQVIDLIFAPGFSTAAQVSDISGRGIGMDVVRTVVEQMGGRVTLQSKLGVGTTVRLDLPMTIAMSRIMVVESGQQLFGISMDAVSETVRLTPDRISQVKNNEGFVLRDRIVPIVSLAELMKLPRQARDKQAETLILVVETGGRLAAFEIDAIRDRMEVVLKPMQGLLANARGYLGTTLLGNGQVLLVLDVKEIMP